MPLALFTTSCGNSSDMSCHQSASSFEVPAGTPCGLGLATVAGGGAVAKLTWTSSTCTVVIFAPAPGPITRPSSSSVSSLRYSSFDGGAAGVDSGAGASRRRDFLWFFFGTYVIFCVVYALMTMSLVYEMNKLKSARKSCFVEEEVRGSGIVLR